MTTTRSKSSSSSSSSLSASLTFSNSSISRRRFVGSTSYGRPPDILSGSQSLRFTIFDFQNLSLDDGEFFDTTPLKAHNHLWKLTICPKFRSSSNSDELWLSCFLFCIDASTTNTCKAVGTIQIGGSGSSSGSSSTGSDSSSSVKSFQHEFQNEGSWCGENEMLSYQDVIKKCLDNQGSLVIDVHIQIYIPKPKVWYPNKAQQQSDNNQQFYAKQLLDHPVGSDIVFVIGSSKERFPAHKCILFPRAPGLYEYVTESAEFSHASIDEYENNEEIFHFEDITPTTFKALLDHIYAGSLPECSTSTEQSEEGNGLGLGFARNLLLVSHRFQCQHLKLYIESEIVSKLVTTTTAADWLALSDDIDCPLLKEACLETYVENPTSVRKSNGWSKVQGLPTLLDEVLDYLANKYHHPSPQQQHNNNTNNTQDCCLYDRMSVGELREQCELYDLELIGTRDILIQRLITNSYNTAQIQIEQVAAEAAAASKKNKNNNNSSEETTEEEEEELKKSVVTSKKEEVANDDDDNGERIASPPLPSTGNNNPSTTTLVDGVKSDKANIDDDDDDSMEEDPSIVKECEPDAPVDDSNNNNDNSNGTIFFSPIQHVVASKQRTKLRELEQSFVAHKSSSPPPSRTGIIIKSSPLLLHGSSSKSVTFVDEIDNDVFVDATSDQQQQEDTGIIITTKTEDLVVPVLPSSEKEEEAESIITNDLLLADDKMDCDISKQQQQQQVAAGPVAVSFDDDDDDYDDDDLLSPPQQEETSASLTTEEDDDDDDCEEEEEEDHFQDVPAANGETTGLFLVDYVEEGFVEGQEAVAVVEGTTTDDTIAADESTFINTPRDTVANFPFSDDDEHEHEPEQDDTSYPEVNAESSAAADAKVIHDLCGKEILKQQPSVSYPDPEDPSPEKTPETSFVDDPQQYHHHGDNLGSVAAAVAKIDDFRNQQPDPIVVVKTKNNDSQSSAMKENNDAVVIVDKKNKNNNEAAVQSFQRVFARRDIIKNISANKAKKIFSKHSLWGSSTSSQSTSTTAGRTIAAASPVRQPSTGQSI